MNTRPLEDRFWEKVDKSGDCWLWTASTSGDGYGRIGVTGKWMQLAHRVAWELLRGPIPEGLQIDHLCRVRACVNPDHLETVTQRENILRGEGMAAKRAAQTHCRNGHPFSEENTYHRPDRRGRTCRTCRTAYMKAYRQAH